MYFIYKIVMGQTVPLLTELGYFGEDQDDTLYYYIRTIFH